MTYPMMTMQPRDIHVGVLSQDKGNDTKQGYINAGDMIVEKITNPQVNEGESETDSEESPVVWDVYTDKEEIKKDLNAGRIYGALIIPEDFTEKQTAPLDTLNKLNKGVKGLSKGMSQMNKGTEAFDEGLGALPEAFVGLEKGDICYIRRTRQDGNCNRK